VDLLLLGSLLVAGALGIAVVELTIRRTDVGAALVLGIVLVEEISWIDLSPITAPVRVGLGDVLLVVLLTAAVARSLRMPRLSRPQMILIALVVIAAWAVVRGLGPFGMQNTVNAARRILSFLAAAWYFATADPKRDLLDRIGRLWLMAAGALAVITLARWSGHAVGLTDGFFKNAGSMRVVFADPTLMLVQGSFIALPFLLDGRRRVVRWLGPTLLAFVVLLQHRTVWVVAAAGILYLLSRERTVAKATLAAMAAAALIVGVLVFTVFDTAREEVGDQLAESAQSDDTFRWRVEGWRLLLRDQGPQDLEEVSVGRPFGSSYARMIVPGQIVEVSPHNFYLESFLRVGAIGLALLVWLYAIGLRGTHLASRSEPSDELLLSPGVLHVLVVTQLLYYITYSPDAAQGLLLGLACAVAAHTPTAPRSQLDRAVVSS
jgi:hypothetical protein